MRELADLLMTTHARNDMNAKKIAAQNQRTHQDLENENVGEQLVQAARIDVLERWIVQ